MMTAESKVITVFGATGQQGGATVRALAQATTFHIRAVTRSVTPAKEASLKALGAHEVVSADLSNYESVEKALEGAYGAFLVTANDAKEGSFDIEVAQGSNFIRAAQSASPPLQHVVFTSVGLCDRAEEYHVPHFHSKWVIEQELTQSKVPATIIRPVQFYDNFAKTSPIAGFFNNYLRGVDPNLSIHSIATHDIGRAVAAVFSNRSEWVGATIEFASEGISFNQRDALHKKVWGRGETRMWAVPAVAVRTLFKFAAPNTAPMVRLFQEVGYKGDFATSKRLVPDLWTYEDYLRADKAAHEEQLKQKKQKNKL